MRSIGNLISTPDAGKRIEGRIYEGQQEGARQGYRCREEEDRNRNRLEKGVQEIGQEEVKKRHKVIDPRKARAAAGNGIG